MAEPLRLWSVTTLIKEGLGTSRNLVDWAVDATAEAAIDNEKVWKSRMQHEGRDSALKYLAEQRYATTNKAKDRGSDIHKAADALALGAPIPDIDEILWPYVEQYAKFLREFRPEFVLSEAPVYNLTKGYAGTLDAVLKIDGVPLLADIKTTEHGPDAVTRTGRPKMRPPYQEAALQLAAYQRAEVIGLLANRKEVYYKRYYEFDPDDPGNTPMLETAGAVVITVSPHDYYVTPVRTDDQIFRSFLAVKEAARFRLDHGKPARLFGTRLTPPLEVVA